MLTLDLEGLEVLRRVIEQHEIGFVVLDSSSRLKPADVSENKPDEIGPWLDSLASLAMETRAYVLLIAHTGHQTDRDGGRPISATRGATSYGQVAQVAMTFRREASEPALRVLRAEGNAMEDTTTRFVVADVERGESAGHINRFQPLEARSPEAILASAGMVPGAPPISAAEYTRRTHPAPPNAPPDWRPSGYAQRKAKDELSTFEKRGLVVQTDKGWIRAE
jgi:hypothetical protein